MERALGDPVGTPARLWLASWASAAPAPVPIGARPAAPSRLDPQALALGAGCLQQLAQVLGRGAAALLCERLAGLLAAVLEDRNRLDPPYWTTDPQVGGLEIRDCEISARRANADGAFNTDGFDVRGRDIWIQRRAGVCTRRTTASRSRTTRTTCWLSASTRRVSAW